MKRKKKKLKRIKLKKSKKLKSKKIVIRQKKIIKRKPRIKRIKNSKIKKIRKKTKSQKKKTVSLKLKRKKTPKTRAVVAGILSLSDKLKSMLRFKFNLDKSLQNFFQGISNRVSDIRKVIQEEREKQKKIKIQAMYKEKIEAQKRFRQQEELAIKAKTLELREEEKLGRERKIELQKFIRLEQAELRNERAEKQRKFLEQIALEKKIEQFRKREALEIKNLEKYVLSQQRESYEEVKLRIDKIKEKYKALREQKVNEAIRERVAQLGIKIEDTDNRETLLEKERVYNKEREKIEYALESFYRSAHSLCFQINKRYIPKYLSIMRVVDRRFETGEIFIKWDDTAEDDWLILIYIKNNTPDEGIVIEDKSDSEKHKSYEFKSNEIFKASDLMVDSLTKLLDRERNRKKVS
tara:strand:- start:2838 stop:4061 length:1224 start_codon:yes stop_codon:yes gene_type:complete